MNKNKQIISNYLKSVAKNLQVSRILKSTFIHELKDSVTSFASENKDITIDDLYNEFGTPKEISEGFLDRKDYNVLLAKAKKRAMIWKILGISVSLLLILLICFVGFLLRQYGGEVYVSDVY